MYSKEDRIQNQLNILEHCLNRLRYLGALEIAKEKIENLGYFEKLTSTEKE